MVKDISGRKALIVTGEASGDLHGANLISAAKELDPGLSFMGVGGKRMAEEGCDILIPSEELSVMGLVEVLEHFPIIYRHFNTLKKLILSENRPDVLVLIDSPDFNLRLAKVAHRAGVPVLYYISPQVWAWRRGRVKKIAQIVDRMAVILPFEPRYYDGHDIEVLYVGNPLLDEAAVTQERPEFLANAGILPDGPVVGLFPGSRRNEIKFNFETILDTAEILAREKPDAKFVLPVASAFDDHIFTEATARRNLPIVLTRESIYNVANACDAILTVSGTVTLQIALVGTPQVILYKMAPLTYSIGKRLIKVDHIGLVNIVGEHRVVQEYIQDEASSENLAREILRILDDEAYNRKIREGLAMVRRKMGDKGCSARVAQMAIEMSQGVVRTRKAV